MNAVEIVHDFWSAVWNPPYDLDAIDRFVVEDFVIVTGGEEIVSRAAFKEWVAAFQSKITDLRLEPVESFQNADGSRVVSQWTLTGLNNGILGTAPNREPIHMTGTAVWTVREDGMLLRNRVERNAWEAYRRLTADPGPKPLAGTVTLVTGASSGIGAATAQAVVGLGGAVALVARRADRLDELTAQITERGGSSLVLAADLADARRAEGSVQAAVDHFGRLDALVNHAGHAAPGDVEHGDPDEWDRLVDVNVRAVLRMSHAALPHLLRAAAEGPRRVADLVTVGSVAGRWPRKGNSVYSASKHAVAGFSEALRQEMAGRGVRVCLVEPGMTSTEMTRGSRVGSGRGTPPELWLRVEDIADAITYAMTRPPHAAVNELVIRPAAQQP